MHSERSNYKKKKISQRPGTHETKTQHQMQPKTEKKQTTPQKMLLELICSH
jgi:hypothetical protein